MSASAMPFGRRRGVRVSFIVVVLIFLSVAWARMEGHRV
jgi:hypothetical protein